MKTYRDLEHSQLLLREDGLIFLPFALIEKWQGTRQIKAGRLGLIINQVETNSNRMETLQEETTMSSTLTGTSFLLRSWTVGQYFCNTHALSPSSCSNKCSRNDQKLTNVLQMDNRRWTGHSGSASQVIPSVLQGSVPRLTTICDLNKT